MIYTYDIIAPLKYNCFKVNTANSDSESRFEIPFTDTSFNVRFVTSEIPGEDFHVFDDKVTISLRTEKAKDSTFEAKESSWTKSMPDRISPFLICEIKGLLVDDEKYAIKFTEEILNKICQGLSFALIKINVNRHLYQPRVEPDWPKVRWISNVYKPFTVKRMEALDKLDPTVKHLEEHIIATDEAYCVSTTSLRVSETDIRTWLLEKDDVVEFLLNEYYCALGSEKIKSKFFHLFSIIEFCEKEFEEHNGAKGLLSKDQAGSIMEVIEDKLKDIDIKPSDKDTIKSRLNGLMLKMNDTGRTVKLLNIMKWMGIESFSRFDETVAIDEELLDEIIELRNKSFHGGKEKIEDAEKKYRDAVEKLLYIDEKIISYLKGQVDIEDDPDGVYRVNGQGVRYED